MKVSLNEIVGGGYREFWNFNGRYRVVKGGRGSKKSTTAALWLIYNIMRYYHSFNTKPNALVIRRYHVTHRNSTFAQLKWAINKLGVKKLWAESVSSLCLTYKPSGQKIIFRGIDDPQSITSITTDDGHLCWVWWEEAFQVTNEEDFNMVDLSIRGKLPYPLFKQHTLVLNPWSEKHWIKRRFFDSDDANILALTKNYDCNEFLGQDDLNVFESMKTNSPRRYSIEGLGEWGISEGLIFENWEVKEFDFNAMRRGLRIGRKFEAKFGLDFGFTNDPTAFIALIVDTEKKEIYIGHEVYKHRLLNTDIYNEIKRLGFQMEQIIADSADPKSIEELRNLGLTGIKGAKKGKDSVVSGIHVLQEYKIYVHPRCEHTQIELLNYIWSKERMTGKFLNAPIDDYNHLMDAMRYATENINISTFRWEK